MNKTLLFLLLSICACSNDPRNQLPPNGLFGDHFVIAKNSMSASNLNVSDTHLFKVTQIWGEVDNYCKGEGCWLTLKMKENESLRVNTYNKHFILPKNIEGKKAIAQGKFVETEKNGKKQIYFEATGIILE